jgi:hypothetical protein
MGAEEARDEVVEAGRATDAQFTGEGQPGEAPAWEEVDAGRYMPRRIRGSLKGRALG